MFRKQWIVFFAFWVSTSCQAAGEWSFFEELLYWHASQGPTSTWAYQFSLNTNNLADPLSQGTNFVEPNIYFGWDAGLRVGVKEKDVSYFDKQVYWTHFSTKTQTTIMTGEDEFLVPQFFNGFTTTSIYNTAAIKWDITMNMVDAKIGHDFHPLDDLNIHPTIGIKGGSIHQSLYSAWQMKQLGFIVYQANENLDNNFSGIGPSFSIDSHFNFYKGLSLLGNFETAILWGHWHISDDFYRPNSLFYQQKTIFSQTNDHLGSFMTGYFLGFEWAFELKALVKIKAGYELEFWANQLRLPLFQALPIHGDLTLQGATCGIYITL